MGCKLSKEKIDQTIEFHGHTCPGLAIGIRVSELAIEELKIDRSNSPVCLVETDMCGVDAIQFLTGCTYGKGNLIHKDYGKAGFTFFDRDMRKGFRAVFKDGFRSGNDPSDEIRKLMTKMADEMATDQEKQRAKDLRATLIDRIMNADLKDLFSVEEMRASPARPARILDSIQCQGCGEMVMESRIRRFDGQYLCIPCFMKIEQKV
jgi:formylmethanofuran dehydrogenase subunit E